MAFTLGVIEFSAINDPNGLVAPLGSTGESTLDIGSGANLGDTISFGSVATTSINIATSVLDDSGEPLASGATVSGLSFSAGESVESDYEMILQDPVTGFYYRMNHLSIDNTSVGVTLSQAWDATTGTYVGFYTPGTVLTVVDGDTLDGTPNVGNFQGNSLYADDGGLYGDDTVLSATGTGLVTCFTTGTQIETANGLVAIEDLVAGDLVMTADHGLQPLRWLGRRKLDAIDLAANPHLRPIRITAGALGGGLPARDLLVSPQHRMLVRSKIAQRMFAAAEVLVAAKQLVAVEGIEVAEDVTEVEYFHALFDRHQIVFAEGAATESFYVGAQAIKSLDNASAREIYELFPELETRGEDMPAPARMLVKGRPSRNLAERHARNGVALVN